MSLRARVLVVDDDRGVRQALQINLTKAGYDVSLAEGVPAALEQLRQAPADLVLTDVRMPGQSGLELLGMIRTHWPETRVVVMTGYGSVTDAVSAMKAGAADYIIKPIEREELLILLDRALQARALQARLRQLQEEVEEKYGFASMVGASPKMQAVYQQIRVVADSTATVLIEGETGTGKELIARAIHYRSRRSSGPMVAVNCGALPESLLESELFGHEKGAFTGAIRQHHGKFEQADGGTLFLDEVGEMPLSTQVRLLRVLEGGAFTRVGGGQEIKVDVRVIAATNRTLRQQVQEKAFRADLYYRLNVVSIELPPLRERVEDIPLLARHFLQRFCAPTGAHPRRRPPDLSPEALLQLQRWRWPGNVRELEHLMERTALLTAGDTIERLSLPDPPPEPPPLAGPAAATLEGPSLAEVEGLGLPEAVDAYERRLIIEALHAAGGVQARAARQLGISRSNLNYRIQRLGIVLDDIRFR